MINSSDEAATVHNPGERPSAPRGGQQAVFFFQECPACGRALRTPVALLGKTLSCRHCGCRLTARDPSLPTRRDEQPPSALERAEQLLQQLHDRRR